MRQGWFSSVSLPGARRYRASTRTGRPADSILKVGEIVIVCWLVA